MFSGLKLKTFSGDYYHLYHLVDESPWPYLGAFAAGLTTVGGVMYMHNYIGGFERLMLGFFYLLVVAIGWWNDVIYEATYEGAHTTVVQNGLRMGMILFIVSEVMFFLAFFWGFFHSSLAPAIELGSIWPPAGIAVFDPQGVPLLNTLILLLSGVTITYAHHYMVAGQIDYVEEGFILTIVLAVSFTLLQIMEYVDSGFTISDSVYGSTFFMATGFHGAHVIIGTLFIIVCFLRTIFSHYTREHHFGFEAAAWYWHFVDVVWLFLFVSIYWWGGL
jgi:cytochrome c oxidase subunit 3